MGDSNQVYRNDSGLGSAKYVPMTGNNFYGMTSPPINIAPTVSLDHLPWNTNPTRSFDNDYINVINGVIHILQDGVYSITITLEITSPTPSTQAVLAFALILYNLTLGIGLKSVRREQTIYVSPGFTSAPTAIVNLDFTGYFYANDIVSTIFNNVADGGGNPINITNNSFMYITKIE